jgi:hypothetical protein
VGVVVFSATAAGTTGGFLMVIMCTSSSYLGAASVLAAGAGAAAAAVLSWFHRKERYDERSPAGRSAMAVAALLAAPAPKVAVASGTVFSFVLARGILEGEATKPADEVLLAIAVVV